MGGQSLKSTNEHASIHLELPKATYKGGDKLVA